jgi:hypothetical protein
MAVTSWSRVAVGRAAMNAACRAEMTLVDRAETNLAGRAAGGLVAGRDACGQAPG